MSGWRLLEKRGAIEEWFRQDPVTGEITIRVTQDVEEQLKINQIEQNERGKDWKGDFVHYASVPYVVVEQWWKEMGSNPFSKENIDATNRKLNDRDWRKLRVNEGKL